jgi:predicted  nucleic acid-binding Zn-ribbon protein
MTDTEDYVTQMRARLDQWNDRMEKLEAALGRAQATGQPGTDELLILVNNLRRQQEEMRKSIQAMQSARTEERRQLQNETSLKMSDMQDSFDKAMVMLQPD